MSRFANVTATEPIEIPGPCQCGPTSTHTTDVAQRRKELGQGVKSVAISAGMRAGGGMINPVEVKIALVALAYTSWNLLGHDGQVMPFTEDSVRLLDETTLDFLAGEADKAIKLGDPLPNPSDAPSATSSPGSASNGQMTSPTPTIPTPATPTMPS